MPVKFRINGPEETVSCLCLGGDHSYYALAFWRAYHGRSIFASNIRQPHTPCPSLSVKVLILEEALIMDVRPYMGAWRGSRPLRCGFTRKSSQTGIAGNEWNTASA